MTPEQRTDLVKAHARHLGFTSAGVASLEAPPHDRALQAWLEHGMAGTMGYMRRQAAKRLNPVTIVRGATCAIMLTRDYHNPDTPSRPGTGRVAKYARGRDYHAALRHPLGQLASYVRSLGGRHTIARSFVDAGPVPERELAQRAGLGWIGKNTMLIDPRRGSYFFLAAVLTNLELALDRPFEEDRCGSCRRCRDACPTGALVADRVLDSRRCISYLTIEHRGEVDPELGRRADRWIFGCDVCQDVCPWNQKFARPTSDTVLEITPSLEHLDLNQWARMSDEQFTRRFGHTPLARPGLSGMRRNAAVAAANERGRGATRRADRS